MRPSFCRPTLAVALVALTLPFGACGGGDDSSKQDASTGATAGSGPTGTASKGATGATGKEGTSRGSKGSSGNGQNDGKKQRKRSSSSGGTGGTAKEGQKKQGTSKKKSAKAKRKHKSTGPSSNYTPQEYELYRESKIVCRANTLSGLAAQYHVAHKPSAVAAAYAQAYVDTFKNPAVKGAVAAGCEAGVTG
jgi:hypothetical protein